jgi:phage regulator Rha-like protein
MNLIQSNNKTMSSREIADLVESRHDSVKRAMERMGLKGVITFTPMVEPTKGGGKPVTVYHVNQRDSYVVVAQLDAAFTGALVDRWHELESKELETPEQLMARALISAQSVIDAKDKQLEEAKPAIELHESIVNDDHTLSMRDAGKRLQVKPNKFVEWLRAAKYLNYDNIAYQSHINSGYLVLSTTEHNGKPRTNTRVTGKGFAHFGKKIAELRFSKPDHNIFYK